MSVESVLKKVALELNRPEWVAEIATAEDTIKEVVTDTEEVAQHA
jgi:hypothetical protein